MQNLYPAIISATSGLLGVMIGGLITYVVQRTQRRHDKEEERKALACGIAAELEAYLDLMDARNHAASIKSLIASLHGGQDLKLSVIQRADGRVPDFFPLTFAQLNKVGLLGEITADLARFYTGLAGVFATMDTANSGRFDGLPIANKIDLLEKELALWENTTRVGRATVMQLKKIA
ncbi:MAG TPA: hypothetical protein VF955_06875 [Pyrinomonadaceae bacterium]